MVSLTFRFPTHFPWRPLLRLKIAIDPNTHEKWSSVLRTCDMWMHMANPPFEQLEDERVVLSNHLLALRGTCVGHLYHSLLRGWVWQDWCSHGKRIADKAVSTPTRQAQEWVGFDQGLKFPSIVSVPWPPANKQIHLARYNASCGWQKAWIFSACGTLPFATSSISSQSTNAANSRLKRNLEIPSAISNVQNLLMFCPIIFWAFHFFAKCCHFTIFAAKAERLDFFSMNRKI